MSSEVDRERSLGNENSLSEHILIQIGIIEARIKGPNSEAFEGEDQLAAQYAQLLDQLGAILELSETGRIEALDYLKAVYQPKIESRFVYAFPLGDQEFWKVPETGENQTAFEYSTACGPLKDALDYGISEVFGYQGDSLGKQLYTILDMNANHQLAHTILQFAIEKLERHLGLFTD